MDFNLKKDLNIGLNSLKETTLASLTEIFILVLSIYCLLNNLNRFSNKKIVKKFNLILKNLY